MIRGYYTLSAASIDFSSLPPETAKRLPRYPQMPAALLGRLAVDVRSRGTRSGELLLADALQRVLLIEASMGIIAVVVDALDERAAGFYERYEFQRFPERPRRLFLPMRKVRDMFR